MIDKSAVTRFLRKCGTPQPYRFLTALVAEDYDPPKCRQHGELKVEHTYGTQLWVCPKCFPAEART